MLGLAVGLAIVTVNLSGCGSVEDAAGTGAESAAGCVPDREYFQKKVSLPILEKRCIACHTATGLARHSKLILATPAESNALERNFQTLRDFSAYQYEGTPLLLLKPTNQLPHGGGLQLAPDGDELKAIAGLLQRFAKPNQCEAPPSDLKLIQRVGLRDLANTARHAKLQMVASLPTTAELARVAAEGESGLRALVLEWVKLPAFRSTLLLWANELFLTDKYLGWENALGLLDDKEFPNRHYFYGMPDGKDKDRERQLANDSVAREPLELFAWIVQQDRPFTDLVTADFTLVNPWSAKVYGVSDADFGGGTTTASLAPGHVPGHPAAGVLTSPMFLNRFPTTATNLNRHRARMAMDFFLATDILKAGERPTDPSKVTDHNPTVNNPACSKCHADLDPMAGAFQWYDDRGRYRAMEKGWPENLPPPGYKSETLPSSEANTGLVWLGKRIAADERFPLAATRLAYRGLVGRAPVDNPTDETDPGYAARLAFYNIEQEFLARTAAALKTNGMKLASILPDILLSPFYRAQTATGLSPEESAALAPLGTAALSWPERLDGRLRAVTGAPWKRKQKDANKLLNENEYLFFYGGIDSDKVTTRITEPNGIIANIGYRMANEVACYSVPRDLTKQAGERLLLPHVEASFEPEDENGFLIPEAVERIRENVRWLHRHVLGEELTAASPEVEATYQLFYETWKEGKALVATGALDDHLHWLCVADSDFVTDAALPKAQQVRNDANYTVRAWMAVVTYLLLDWRFLHD